MNGLKRRKVISIPVFAKSARGGIRTTTAPAFTPSSVWSDPNRMDDEEYIVRLIGQVITVSVETVKVVKALPEFQFK